MSTLEDIIDAPESLECKRAVAVKMFISDFKTEDICHLLNVSDSFVSKWKIIYENEGVQGLGFRLFFYHFMVLFYKLDFSIL